MSRAVDLLQATLPLKDFLGIEEPSTATRRARNFNVDTVAAQLSASGPLDDRFTSVETAMALAPTGYQGTWNANTNTPTIPAAATANKGYYYRVAVAGTTNIDGISSWAVGDYLYSNGTVWEKIANPDAVASVNAKTGAVLMKELVQAHAVATGSSDPATWSDSSSADGYGYEIDDVVLRVSTTLPEKNGLWHIHDSAPATRLEGYSTYDGLVGLTVYIRHGDARGGLYYRCVSPAGGTIDTTPISFDVAPVERLDPTIDDWEKVVVDINRRIVVGTKHDGSEWRARGGVLVTTSSQIPQVGFMGDSHSTEFPDILASRLGFAAINYAVSGDSSSNMIARMADFIAEELTAGVLYAGANDPGAATTVAASPAPTDTVFSVVDQETKYEADGWITVDGELAQILSVSSKEITLTAALAGGAPSAGVDVEIDTQRCIEYMIDLLLEAGVYMILVVGRHYLNFTSGGDTTASEQTAAAALRTAQQAAAASRDALYVDCYKFVSALILSAREITVAAGDPDAGTDIVVAQGDYAHYHVSDGDAHLITTGADVMLARPVEAAMLRAGWFHFSQEEAA